MKPLKRTFFILILLVNTYVFSFAQTPQKVSYQSVIRNTSGELVRSKTVGIQISILQGSASGTAIYVETHTPVTNVNGLASIEVGNGTPVSGIFSDINWANGPYFLKVETDPSVGTTYSITGTTEILSVPYALHAKSVKGKIDADSTVITDVADPLAAQDAATKAYVDKLLARIIEIEDYVYKVPTVSTNTITNITCSLATSGGSITSDGGTKILSRGVCWNTTGTPTTSNDKTIDSIGTGNFTSHITELLEDRTYYIRAYATNIKGTAYGEQFSFKTGACECPFNYMTDSRDDHIYKTIQIGQQTWMAENLAYIPDTTGWYPIKEYRILDYEKYGVLYNWRATTNICPAGWHLPSNEEWTTLEAYLSNNGYGYGGSGNDIAKALASKNGWRIDNTAIGIVGNEFEYNNESCFSALPSGYSIGQDWIETYLTYVGYWWSSTVEQTLNMGNGYIAAYPFFRNIGNWSANLESGYCHEQNEFSVRCVKD